MEKQKTSIVKLGDVKNVYIEETELNRLVVVLEGAIRADMENGHSIQRASDIHMIFRSLRFNTKDDLIIRLYERIDEGLLKAIFLEIPGEKNDTYFIKGEKLYDDAMDALEKVRDKLLTEAML